MYILDVVDPVQQGMSLLIAKALMQKMIGKKIKLTPEYLVKMFNDQIKEAAVENKEKILSMLDDRGKENFLKNMDMMEDDGKDES
jgi:hypothetical protein